MMAQAILLSCFKSCILTEFKGTQCALEYHMSKSLWEIGMLSLPFPCAQSNF